MKSTIIADPGNLHPGQGRLNYDQGDLFHYVDAPVRVVRGQQVLAVRSIMVASDPFDEQALMILEGHTRSCEAARQRVGIEAYLLREESDAYRVPRQCTGGYSISAERLAYNFRERARYRRRTMDSKVITINDLMKTWYNLDEAFLARLRAERAGGRPTSGGRSRAAIVGSDPVDLNDVLS